VNGWDVRPNLERIVACSGGRIVRNWRKDESEPSDQNLNHRKADLACGHRAGLVYSPQLGHGKLESFARMRTELLSVRGESPMETVNCESPRT